MRDTFFSKLVMAWKVRLADPVTLIDRQRQAYLGQLRELNQLADTATSLVGRLAVGHALLAVAELDPAIAPTQGASLPADPAEIARLPVFSPAISQQVIGRIMLLITAMQALVAGVAVVTLLAAASMSIQEWLRELGVLHAVGCTPPSSRVPRRSARAPLERSAPPSVSPWA